MSTLNLDPHHAVLIDVNQLHGVVDGVPVSIVEAADHDGVRTWTATVHAGNGRSVTSVVNSREDAEVIVVALAAKAKEISQARKHLTELEGQLARMAGEFTRQATDARKTEANDEPPF